VILAHPAVSQSLVRACEKCIDARRNIAEGISPAIEKQREKRRPKESKSFGEFGEKWLTAAAMADSTRATRRSIFERELLPVWRNRLLTEISPDDLRAHCARIVDRGAPATAIHVRDILSRSRGLRSSTARRLPVRKSELQETHVICFPPDMTRTRRCVGRPAIV
jgi:hypothetical protein